ncbi:sensor histidine kinase [Chitinophaga skermanii]|nr:HAMP domain-containing sensor histidine kinase [Chitinophaga skermanii]
MDFIVKRIWWIAIPTALAVTVFQLYWLFSVYTNQQQNFQQVASDALQKAYDQAMVEAIEKMGLKGKIQGTSAPGLPLSAERFDLSGDIHVGDRHDTSKKRPVSRGVVTVFSGDMEARAGNSDTMLVRKNVDLKAVGVDPKRLLSSIFSMSNIVSVDTAVLRRFYTKELAARNIHLPFTILTLSPADTSLQAPMIVNLRADSYSRKPNIAAQFQGLSGWLFVKILWPIVLSFLLVVLIIFCIWILWRIIIKQKKLEVMKNDFISNITHELKTPVAILSATNETLLDFGGMHDPEKTSRYLQLEREELRKLQLLLDRIVQLTRLEHHAQIAGPVTAIALDTWLPSVLARFSKLQGVQLVLTVQLDNPVIHTEAAYLETIIVNLVDNAIKYTAVDNRWVSIRVTGNEEQVIILVQDRGIGIATSQLALIFDKFYRVPQGNVHDVKGYGLGLSHVKSLVTELNGHISVTSELGKGTTFTIHLKRAWNK